MQLPAPFLALLATVTLALISVDARPVKSSRTAGGMITLPVRRVQRDVDLHVELVSNGGQLRISPYKHIPSM
jgi:hypothetical protein